MPEMPEVETIARKLRKHVVGKRITNVELSGLPLRRPIADTLRAALEGRVVRRIHRRGKYLVMEMDPRGWFVVHLGMSGRIFYRPGAFAAQNHTHAKIRFSDATALEYCDHRRFGLLAAYDVARINDIPELKGLGADPLSAGFDPARFRQQLKESRQQVKSFLLDQRKIAGLGNIYVCEALFLARLHPERRCHTLTAHEAKRLFSAVRAALRAGVRHRGTTFSDFQDADGEPGGHQDYLQVYQREGEKCRRCDTPIVRLRQANRSTFCCARCQQ
jgi:formamidopyrimidine-DNA glycosylase